MERWSRTTRTRGAVAALAAVAVVGAAAPGAASSPTRVAATSMATPDVRYLHLSTAAFTGDADVAVVRDDTTGCIGTDRLDWVDAPLDLPDGAVIQGFEAFYDDRDSGDVLVRLVAHDTAAAARHEAPARHIVHARRSPRSAPGYDVMASTAAVDAAAATIDNHERSYRVQARMGSGQQLCGVLVHWRPPFGDGLTFHPVPACAVLDTRVGKGGMEEPLRGDQLLSFDVIRDDHGVQGGARSACGIPPARSVDAPGGTVAVLVRLLALEASHGGNLRAWDPDVDEPAAPVLVFRTGRPETSILPLAIEDGEGGRDAGGAIRLRHKGPGTVHVRAVVLGYYTTAEAG